LGVAARGSTCLSVGRFAGQKNRISQCVYIFWNYFKSLILELTGVSLLSISKIAHFISFQKSEQQALDVYLEVRPQARSSSLVMGAVPR
jgi:hypothetical protein